VPNHLRTCTSAPLLHLLILLSTSAHPYLRYHHCTSASLHCCTCSAHAPLHLHLHLHLLCTTTAAPRLLHLCTCNSAPPACTTSSAPPHLHLLPTQHLLSTSISAPLFLHHFTDAPSRDHLCTCTSSAAPGAPLHHLLCTSAPLLHLGPWHSICTCSFAPAQSPVLNLIMLNAEDMENQAVVDHVGRVNYFLWLQLAACKNDAVVARCPQPVSFFIFSASWPAPEIVTCDNIINPPLPTTSTSTGPTDRPLLSGFLSPPQKEQPRRV